MWYLNYEQRIEGLARPRYPISVVGTGWVVSRTTKVRKCSYSLRFPQLTPRELSYSIPPVKMSVERDAAPNIGRHVQVLAVVDGRLTFFETAFGNNL